MTNKFAHNPAAQQALIPSHVGRIGTEILFEEASYEPVMVDVPGMYIDGVTGKETKDARWFKYDEDNPETIIDSGDNLPKQIHATIPGTDILAYKKGGGEFYATLMSTSGQIMDQVAVPVSTLSLKDQADLLRIAGSLRPEAAEFFSVKYGMKVSERP